MVLSEFRADWKMGLTGSWGGGRDSVQNMVNQGNYTSRREDPGVNRQIPLHHLIHREVRTPIRARPASPIFSCPAGVPGGAPSQQRPSASGFPRRHQNPGLSHPPPPPESRRPGRPRWGCRRPTPGEGMTPSPSIKAGCTRRSRQGRSVGMSSPETRGRGCGPPIPKHAPGPPFEPSWALGRREETGYRGVLVGSPEWHPGECPCPLSLDELGRHPYDAVLRGKAELPPEARRRTGRLEGGGIQGAVDTGHLFRRHALPHEGRCGWPRKW